MVNLAQVQDQLKRVGCNFRFWGHSEVRELAKILQSGETIACCVNGRYEGGFAMLCVTDQRLLLVDHKPMFLSLEDIRFDMIVEIDYSARLLTGSIHIIMPSRKLLFNSWSQSRLRILLDYTQKRVMDIRQQYLKQQFQPAMNQQNAVSMVGGLALQSNSVSTQHPLVPVNPYTRTSLLMRRSSFPRLF